MDIGVHLNFNGNCRQAFEFYRDVFDASLRLFTYGESPAGTEIEDSWKEKIVHANLKIGGKEIAGCDLIKEQFAAPQGFSLLVEVRDEIKVKQLFQALSQGGEVVMEPQKTFWSDHYCVVTDRFGIRWEIY